MKRFLMNAMLLLVLVLGFATNPALAGGDKCCTKSAQCAKTCDAAVKRLEKKKADPALIKTVKECAKACHAHAAGKMDTKECAAICAKCAEACDKSGDPSLKDCAKECHACGDCCAE